MNEVDFESKMKELEEIVKKLENKEISLDDAVSLYMSGLEVSKVCFDILNKKEELVVKKITESGLVEISEER